MLHFRAHWAAALAIAAMGASQTWAQQSTVEDRAAAQQQRSASQAIQLNERSEPSQSTAERGTTTQRTTQQSQMTRQRPGAQDATGVDAKLAAWLIADNRNEVEISRFAQQQSDNDQIRQFAQKMVTDHTQFIQKLQQVAGPAAARSGAMSSGQSGADQSSPAQQPQLGQPTQPSAQTPQSRLSQTDQQQQLGQQPGQQTSPQRTGQQMARSQAGSEDRLDIVELKQQLADKMLESTRRELEEKDGREFNQCFAFHQVAAHLQMLDTLQVFKQHASPELTRILDEGIRTTEQHLAHAKQLAERIDQEGSSGRTQARINQ